MNHAQLTTRNTRNNVYTYKLQAIVTIISICSTKENVIINIPHISFNQFRSKTFSRIGNISQNLGPFGARVLPWMNPAMCNLLRKMINSNKIVTTITTRMFLNFLFKQNLNTNFQHLYHGIYIHFNTCTWKHSLKQICRTHAYCSPFTTGVTLAGSIILNLTIIIMVVIILKKNRQTHSRTPGSVKEYMRRRTHGGSRMNYGIATRMSYEIPAGAYSILQGSDCKFNVSQNGPQKPN